MRTIGRENRLPASVSGAVRRRVSHRPIALDLFSGCGGLTLGLEQAGFRVVGAVEVERLAAETYRVNHPGVRLWQRDIRHLSSFEVAKRLGFRKGDLDLLAGCPPCQGFSSMRTLNGRLDVDDPQNDLLFHYLRFVRDLAPKSLMMENVPGLYTDRRLRKFRNELERLGYRVRMGVLDAADYGVPQRRRRFIMLAGKDGAPVFADTDPARRTVSQTIGMLAPAGRSGDPLHDLPERRSERIMDLIRSVPVNGGSRRDLGEERQLGCHRRCRGFSDVYGRMARQDVAPTITGGCFNPSKGRFLHPDEHRNITLREAALLQSFPPGYFFSLRRGKTNAAVMIGNALPPELIRRHARCIISYLAKARKPSGRLGRYRPLPIRPALL